MMKNAPRINHIEFSEQVRDTFGDRYPDDTSEKGPAAATLWFSSQRVLALLTARVTWPAWSLDMAGGLEWSPLSGRNWANLDFGQLPILLQVGLGRCF